MKSVQLRIALFAALLGTAIPLQTWIVLWIGHRSAVWEGVWSWTRDYALLAAFTVAALGATVCAGYMLWKHAVKVFSSPATSRLEVAKSILACAVLGNVALGALVIWLTLHAAGLVRA